MSRRQSRKSRNQNFIWVIALIVIVVGVILYLKRSQRPLASGPLPSAQLRAALDNHRPTLAFFHSNNCHQCLVMVETLAQVWPEFADRLTLVDVDVYDERNAPLLQSVRLQYIPTLIFYDRTGQAETYVGVMEAEQLRQRLKALDSGG